MSNSPDSEMTDSTEAASKPLPQGILNVLDDAVNEEIPWIIEKLLTEGEQMLVFGAPKVGKSQFALQLACCLAMGEPFLGWPISKQRKVLYLNFEMGKRVFMLRIARHASRLMEERKKRECEESGQKYLCEDDPWHEREEGVLLGKDLLKEINETLKGQLCFSSDFKNLYGDHVPKPANSPQKIKEKSNSKSEGEASQAILVRHWQSVIKDVEPDLVIFDTLSKTHAINESDNSEIQQVLMLIRDICRIPVVATTGNDGGDATSGKRDEGKSIAHIIVHHARKSSSDSKKNGSWMDLDSIRGGSAIRAEADVICGIFFADKKSVTHQKANRHLVVEARNFAPFDQPLTFGKFAFWHPMQLTPEEVEGERNERNKLNELIQELIRDAFVQSGMRGLKIETLERKVREGLKGKAPSKELTEAKLKARLKTLAAEPNSLFEERTKAGNEEDTAKYPHERKGGKTLYWVKDGSDWLDQEPLRNAIQNHEPIKVTRKKPKKPMGAANTGT